MLHHRRLYALHPLLYAAFPVLFLFAQNVRDMPHRDLYLPLAAVIVGAAALTALFALVLRSLHKGALFTTLAVLLFFSFGHVHSLIPSFSISLGDSLIGRSATVMLVWILILLEGFWLTIRTRRDLTGLTKVLFFIGFILVTVQIVQGGYMVVTRPAPPTREITFNLGKVPDRRPDVYYIILDAYTRADILAQMYEFDNSEFLNLLRDRGFYVADSSYANYCVTTHSLASSLNMNYIPEVGDFDIESNDYVPLSDRLKNNDVFDIFRQLGYSIVTLSSGYAHTDIKEADFYITQSRMESEFASILLAGTPIAVFQTKEDNPYGRHRQHILSTLDKIPDVYEMPSPRLVFTHIVSPHPPFVFGPLGEPVQPDWSFNLNDGRFHTRAGGTYEQYISGYRDQLAHINSLLLSMVDRLLAVDAADRPIIILQADHGPRSTFIRKPPTPSTGLRERYAILNAYYLPGVDSSVFYPQITPVNSFRLIFDEYFGAGFGLLTDSCFTQTWERPFDFSDVTERLSEP